MTIINYVTAPDQHHGQVRTGDRGMIRRTRARRHGDRNNTTVISYASWKYDVTLLRNMTYRIRGSKIDQQRRGVTMFFEVTDENDPDVTFCDVKDAFRWARETQPTGADAFLSYRNIWGLGYNQYNAVFKLMAVRLDFDPKRFSTHSARIGGASALASAGLPDRQIKKYKPLEIDRLSGIHPDSASMRAAQLAMVNPATFSITDAKRIHHLA